MKLDYHVVSLSGGKDSTAMLLMMIEKNMPIDEIIFCDTTVEFPQMYKHLEKLEEYIGRKITHLKSDKDFEWYLLHHKKTRGKYMDYPGYSFPWSRSRWCTNRLKTTVISKYFKEIKERCNVVQYIGIAYDEADRFINKPDYVYPLYEWGITEQMALDYCYEKGFNWDGLYEQMTRVSCWVCPLQRIGDVKNLYKNHKELWDKLKEWQSQTWKPFKDLRTVDEYEKRFDWEENNPNQKFFWKYIEKL